MRQEATLTEWKELYEVATRIKELEPWKDLWDMDLIALRFGDDEEPVFMSVLGKGNNCYGLVAYEGYEGLNDFLMLCMHEQMNLSTEYTMYSQTNLTCYWGDRKELSDAQRKIIKDLGYKYRGKNQWLYFMSYLEGYFPYQYDEAEVLRMTKYLNGLEQAVIYYRQANVKVDFEHGDCFMVELENGKIVSGIAGPLPFQAYRFGVLQIDDKPLQKKLKKLKKNGMVLEVDVQYLGSGVKDEELGRPRHPQLCMMCDSSSGMMLAADLTEAGEDPIVKLAENVIGFMEEHGAPAQIYVSNVIIEAALEDVCKLAGVELKRAKRLPGIDEFRQSMGQMR